MNDISGAAKNRRGIRFPPDMEDFAQIDLQLDREDFVSEVAALILEESPMHGCGLVMRSEFPLQPGEMCRIKLGKLAPLKAQLIWRKSIDDSVSRFGFKFLE